MPIYKGNTKVKSLYKGSTKIIKRYKGTDVIYRGLPSAYQEVEYIESSGTQYVDTGYLPQNYCGIDTIFEYTTIPTHTAIQSILSAGTGTYQLVIAWNESTCYFRYFSTGANAVVIVPNSNKKYNLIISSNGTLTIDNSSTTSSYQGNVDTNINLFRRANDTNYFIGKLYSCKLYDNNTLVRDFVPCYRKSDDVIGLYDLVNGVFYTNAGTGTFVKGGNV